jgi:ATP-binding cassette subfamily B protein
LAVAAVQLASDSNASAPVRLLTPYVNERRSVIALGVLCLVLVDLLQLVIPRVIKHAVDDLTTASASGASLARQASVIVGLALLIGLFRYVWRRCLIGASRRVEEGLRLRLFAHLQTLSAPWFDTARTGELMAHATNDVQSVRMATGMGLVALTDALVLGSAAVAFMAWIHPRLTVLVLIPMPLIAFGTRLFSRQMHRRYRAVQAAFSELTETVRERVAGIRVIKAFGTEDAALSAVREASQRNLAENMRLVRVTGAFFPLMVLFSNVSLALILWFGGRWTILGAITAGDFVAFISYLNLLTWPMMAMGWVTNLIQRGRASLERLQAILDLAPQIVEADPAQPVRTLERDLRVTDLDFAYAPRQQGQPPAPVLRAIEFTLPRGGVLGIAGPPGGGKSTLISLLPRLYEPSRGTIAWDGVELRRLRLADLRRAMALVPQEPFLFAGTLRENLLVGRSEADAACLARAIEAAALTETVQLLPSGLETVVGERGVILSGGQKQRVALARALLSPAPLLILDDPVSQVDAETGERIIAALQGAGRERTLIVVSHRLSALRFADQILVLEGGRITERGTHAALLQAGGYYARTFRLQEIEAAYEARAPAPAAGVR